MDNSTIWKVIDKYFEDRKKNLTREAALGSSCWTYNETMRSVIASYFTLSTSSQTVDKNPKKVPQTKSQLFASKVF